MSEANARQLLRESKYLLENRHIDTLDEVLAALVLAVQALTEAALDDDEPTISDPKGGMELGARTAVDEYNDGLRERIAAQLDDDAADMTQDELLREMVPHRGA